MKPKIVDGPIVRKIIYVNRQVEVKSYLVFFELANTGNSYSNQCFTWTVKNMAKKNDVVEDKKKI